jgi:predicted RND superfamily exporter protein
LLDIFCEDNPNLQKWDEYQATFSNTDNVLFVLEFREGVSFARDMAMVIEDLTGRAGALGMKLAPMTTIAPNIIWALAIADCIHITSLVQKNLRAGLDKTAAIYGSLRKNFTAIFIASATTAVGFPSLNYSDAPRFQYLGNLTAFDVFAAWIWAITFVPAFLCFMPLKPAAESKTGLLVRFLAGFTDMVINNARSVLIISGTSSVVLIALAFSNSLDNGRSTYFSKRLKIRKDWAIRGLIIFL